MIKITFSDMETGIIAHIEVSEPVMLRAHWEALAELGIKPVGCGGCRATHEELPRVDDNDPGLPKPPQFPPGWNPDDNLPTS